MRKAELMARKRTAPQGTCRICGKMGPLSYEHVPPQSAFNQSRFIETTLGEEMKDPFGENHRGRIRQGGAGDYTLCGKCNNDTGNWYAKDFAEWCYQGADVLRMSDGHPKLIYLHYIHPLRILKQIIVMAFSVNGPKFREFHPELVEFVLNQDKRWLNPRYRIFAYFNIEGTWRRVGDHMAFVDLNRGPKAIMLTEISHPPFGYVLVTDESQPSEQLVEITHFRRYAYDELEVVPLYLPVLPTHMPIPLDYRSKQEIINQEKQSA
jgi:hypothetical protein